MASKQLKLVNVRVCFPHIFEPRQTFDGAGHEYAACLILDPDNSTTEELFEAIEEAAIERFGRDAPKLMERGKLKSPIHEGEEMERDPSGAFEGKLFINVKSTRQPQVVDKRVQPVIDPEELWSGIYANVSVGVFAFDKKQKGVAVALNNIQVLGRGERISGAPSAEEDFSVIDDDPDDDDDAAEKKPGRRSAQAGRGRPAGHPGKEKPSARPAPARRRAAAPPVEEEVEEEEAEEEDDDFESERPTRRPAPRGRTRAR